VVLDRQQRLLAGGFPAPVWSLAALIVHGEGVDNDRRCAHTESTGPGTRTVWTGLTLSFFRDGGESYWHTLVGEQQEVFVVCQEDEEEGLAPMLVTADYDEAMAYHEADDTVLSAPMPPQIYETLERFVLENYAPAEKKRRKRKQWHSEEQSDEAFSRRPGK